MASLTRRVNPDSVIIWLPCLRVFYSMDCNCSASNRRRLSTARGAHWREHRLSDYSPSGDVASGVMVCVITVPAGHTETWTGFNGCVCRYIRMIDIPDQLSNPLIILVI
jgi:hypothetical protein